MVSCFGERECGGETAYSATDDKDVEGEGSLAAVVESDMLRGRGRAGKSGEGMRTDL